jgi:uncharacterized protein
MNAPMKLLLIYVDENDEWEQLPLYEAIVRRLRRLGIAGATVQVGIMGFGGHSLIHRKGLLGLFGIPDDRPVTISVVDSEEKLRQVLPEICGMVQEGRIVLLDAELIL